MGQVFFPPFYTLGTNNDTTYNTGGGIFYFSPLFFFIFTQSQAIIKNSNDILQRGLKVIFREYKIIKAIILSYI